MHSFFQKNKKFIIVYSILIFVVALALITLSLLGNIEREGYLSEFSYNGYVYSFKINYYDKIFKNSDIYGVYVYFHVQPEYITKIEYQKGGSPFGILYTEKTLLGDDKIDIYYKLRIKYNLLIYILLAIVLIPFFYFKLIKIEYILLIALNTISYYVLIGIILPSFNMVKLRFNLLDIVLSNIFLIFLESFYDYSHFTNLFDKDPFPKEYREWANKSRKISPNDSGGSFNARFSGLTASSPFYPKNQFTKLTHTLPYLLMENGYNTIALEEADITYNLNNFLPLVGITNMVFNIGITNIDAYLDTNLNILNKPIFAYAFTYIGHIGSYVENDFNIKENNKNFFNFFKNENINSLIETLDNSVTTSIEVLKIRDVILKYSPNALIIFKHDHLHPYLRGLIENSSIDNDIKNSFLNDNTPTPILIWDGTNGAYKAPNNFVPENIPMFIAINAGVTNYKNSIISLLYKEEIDGIISTYYKFYKITNDTLVLENNIAQDSEIYKYENAQRILSQDIFQGKKYYYNIIEDLTN